MAKQPLQKQKQLRSKNRQQKLRPKKQLKQLESRSKLPEKKTVTAGLKSLLFFYFKHAQEKYFFSIMKKSIILININYARKFNKMQVVWESDRSNRGFKGRESNYHLQKFEV